mmetsp:Transcript_14211/g.27060  ORF Transcript_14211/g.27060 Transcript_14211/m.27060 type:complete len:272 (+) Transcript_14211:109-924(+)
MAPRSSPQRTETLLNKVSHRGCGTSKCACPLMMQSLLLVEVLVARPSHTNPALVEGVARVYYGWYAPDTGLAANPHRVGIVPGVQLRVGDTWGQGAVVVLLFIIRSQRVLSLEDSILRDSVKLLVHIAERQLPDWLLRCRLLLHHWNIDLVSAAFAVNGQFDVLLEGHGTLGTTEDLLRAPRERHPLHVVGKTVEEFPSDILTETELVLSAVLLLEPLESLPQALLPLLLKHRHAHVMLLLPCIFEAAPLASILGVQEFVCFVDVHVRPVF